MESTAEPQAADAKVGRAPRRAWWRDPDVGGFWVLIAISLLPLWSAHFFPSQDGPAHVYNAMVLRDYHRPQGAIFRVYFELNPSPEPNLLGHWILTALLYYTPAWIAEKLLVSLYIVLLPLSARYAVKAVSAGGSFAAYLSFPFVYSLALHKGLYNFCLGLPLFLFFVGFWLRRDGRFNARGIAGLLLLSLLLYFAHVVALLAAYAVAGALAITQLLAEEMRRGKNDAPLPPRPKNILSRLLVPAIPLVPALYLTLHFFVEHRGERTGVQPVMRALAHLATLSSLVSFRAAERYCSALVAVLFCVLALLGLRRLWVQRSPSRGDLLLPALGLLLLLYFVAPDAASGGGLISLRLMLFFYLLLVLWLAGTPLPTWGQWSVRACAGMLTLWMLATYSVRYHQLNAYLADYAECARFIDPNTTLLTICLSDRGYYNDRRPLRSDQVDRVFIHATDHIAVERHLVDLSNYEATQGYFPLLFRPDLNPEARIGEFGQGLLDYPLQTDDRGRVDYVLVGDVRKQKEDDRFLAAEAELEKGYVRIHTSPLGYVKLYSRKGPDRFAGGTENR